MHLSLTIRGALCAHGACVLLLLAGQAGLAATLPDPGARLVIFGDSLSDTGNLYALTQASLGFGYPPAPYNDGRFTGGDTWVDVVAQDYGLTEGIDLFNYAYGGARAVTTLGDARVDLGEQLALFGASGFAATGQDIAVLFFGGNDIIKAADDAEAALGTTGAATDALAAALMLPAVQALAFGVEALSAAGFGTILVVDSGDVGTTPRFTQPDALGVGTVSGLPLQSAASAASAAFDSLLAGMVADIAPLVGASVDFVDIAALYAAILGDPAAYGITDTQNSCGKLAGVAFDLSFYDFSDATCDESDPQSITAAFWDDVHPNQIIHAQLAGVIEAAIGTAAPVPLPATGGMLAVGLGGAAMLSRLAGRRDRARGSKKPGPA